MLSQEILHESGSIATVNCTGCCRCGWRTASHRNFPFGRHIYLLFKRASGFMNRPERWPLMPGPYANEFWPTEWAIKQQRSVPFSSRSDSLRKSFEIGN
uniref:HDC14029 n=1 Tax=Drosophila melanogaster TaxID=7227 RepID=Q6IJW9_DROME|nr:TPA_inf: HDC14029 [Drosophila melanogaster]